jgi:hypothetical protein
MYKQTLQSQGFTTRISVMIATAPTLETTPPTTYYFAHRDKKRIDVVHGGLAEYYAFYDVEGFIGTDSQDETQLADPANWQFFKEMSWVEVHGDQEPQIFELVENTQDTVENKTAQYPGPFRLEGNPPMAGEAGYAYFPTLRDLVTQQLAPVGADFQGRVLPHLDRLSFQAFIEEPYGSGNCPWERLDLDLGQPLDSYAYHYGQRLMAEQGAGDGTHTLWQQRDGERQYYVETAPLYPFAPTPKLTPLTLAQVQQWYKFEFTPLD